MKIDLTKTNGSSPPTNFSTHLQPLPTEVLTVQQALLDPQANATTRRFGQPDPCKRAYPLHQLIPANNPELSEAATPKQNPEIREGSRRKPLPGLNWKPSVVLTVDRLASDFVTGKLYGLDNEIYAEIKRLSGKRKHQDAAEVKAEAYQQTQLDLHQVTDSEWAGPTLYSKTELALEWARLNTNKAMRQHGWQLRDDEGPRVSLRVGGKKWNLETGELAAEIETESIPDGENEDHLQGSGFHISYRPDWILAHEEEDRRIAEIDKVKAEERRKGEPEPEVEKPYDFMVRILGEERAEWFLAYEYTERNQRADEREPHTDAERAKAARCRRRLEKTWLKEHPDRSIYRTRCVNLPVPVTTHALDERRVCQRVVRHPEREQPNQFLHAAGDCSGSPVTTHALGETVQRHRTNETTCHPEGR